MSSTIHREPVGYVAVWRVGETDVLRANLHVWNTLEKARQDMSQWERPDQYEVMALVPLSVDGRSGSVERPLRLRCGRKQPRNLYIQHGDIPADSDTLCGQVDTPGLAQLIVAAVEAAGAVRHDR